MKFAHLSGTEWVIETVGGISNGSDAGISLVYDSFGNPSMSYIERGQLKFARWNGSSWEIEQVDSQLTNSGGASLAYAPYDPDNPDIRVIRFAWLDEESGFWVYEAVDSGTNCSHAFNSDDSDGIDNFLLFIVQHSYIK